MTAGPGIRAALGVLLFAVVATLGACSQAPDTTVPDLSLSTLDGSVVEISQKRGVPLLVVFFAINNPLALDELSRLESLAGEFADTGLELIAIARSDERPELVGTIAHHRGYLFPIAMDPDGMAASAFGVTTTPSVFLISPDGRLVFSGTGPSNPDELRAKLRGD